MQVRYTVTLEDLVALNLYLHKKSGSGRSGFLMMWLGFPILCAGCAVGLLQLDQDGPACGLIAGAVFWLFTFPHRYRIGLARNVRTFVKRLGGRGVIGARALVFSEELFVTISETFRTEVRWENMEGIDVVGDCAYIFISGISAVILPRHGFDSDEEYEATRDFALRKLAYRSEHEG